MAAVKENDERAKEKDLVDIPNDFFDDFGTKEFLDGLSVIDSWDEDRSATGGKTKLISRSSKNHSNDRTEYQSNRNSYRINEFSQQVSVERRLRSGSRDIDSYIKPGSRRDPNKTNMAIKKDKEVKVKEYLAKALEASDDIRPPGTELDDYYDDEKAMKSDKQIFQSTSESHSRDTQYKPESAIKRTASPWHDRRRSTERYSHRHRGSPTRRRSRSPVWKSSVRHWSPQRRRSIERRKSSNRWRSPYRNRSPDRRRSPGRRYSPYEQRSPLRRHSRNSRDSISDPNVPLNYGSAYPAYYGPPGPYNQQAGYMYSSPGFNLYPSSTYEYGTGPTGYAPQGPSFMPPAPEAAPPAQAVPVPVPVDAAHPVLAAAAPIPQAKPTQSYDTLEQLLVDGKITKEEYQKLTPTPKKGIPFPKPTVTADIQDKVKVLARCQDAISRLSKLYLPHRLVLNASAKPSLPKYLTQKFFSPLKFQSSMEFQFTAANSAALDQQNKQLVDSILATMGLDKVIDRPVRKKCSSTRHAAVQTTGPICDLCDIRENTQYRSVGTSPAKEATPPPPPPQPPQVSEELLRKAASIFSSVAPRANPAGSITHLTPAQLIMQQGGAPGDDHHGPRPQRPLYQNHYMRRPYDDPRGNPRYQNNYNYKY